MIDRDEICTDPKCNSSQDCFCELAQVHYVKYGSDNPSFWKQKESGRKEIVSLECAKLMLDLDQEICAGDLYYAKRNGPGQLLTCDHVANGCIYPREMAYPFNLHECKKVLEIS